MNPLASSVPEQPAETSKKQSPNFGLDEDEHLEKSWVVILEDAIQSNNQSKEDFWAWVMDDFNNFTQGPTQEPGGLQERDLLSSCIIHLA